MSRKISTHEPVTQLRYIPIIECGEPLVDYSAHPRLRESLPIWDYRRETLLRRSVAEGLWLAANALPKGLCFAVTEGWRPPHIQHRMYLASWNRWRKVYPHYSDAALRRVVNRFTAPLNSRVPPPHSTGGALDINLCDEAGNELNMTAPYPRFSGKAYPFDALGLDPVSIERRETMKAALEGSGITNYPSEYWHWSYGDQGWAYRGGYENAIYGAIEPEGYLPDPGGDTDEPLVWVAADRPA